MPQLKVSPKPFLVKIHTDHASLCASHLCVLPPAPGLTHAQLNIELTVLNCFPLLTGKKASTEHGKPHHAETVVMNLTTTRA